MASACLHRAASGESSAAEQPLVHADFTEPLPDSMPALRGTREGKGRSSKPSAQAFLDLRALSEMEAARAPTPSMGYGKGKGKNLPGPYFQAEAPPAPMAGAPAATLRGASAPMAMAQAPPTAQAMRVAWANRCSSTKRARVFPSPVKSNKR